MPRVCCTGTEHDPGLPGGVGTSKPAAQRPAGLARAGGATRARAVVMGSYSRVCGPWHVLVEQVNLTPWIADPRGRRVSSWRAHRAHGGSVGARPPE